MKVLTPEEASLISVLAQAYQEGAKLEEFEDVVADMGPEFRELAGVLFEEIPEDRASNESLEIADWIRNWAKSLNKLRIA